MNRGFVHYFSKGLKTAAGLLLKGGKYVRYYLYFFATLLGRCIPVLGMIFPVADMRRARIAEEENELTVLGAYKGVETGHSFGTTVLTRVLISLIMAGGCVAIALVAIGLGWLGVFVSACINVSKVNEVLLPIVFALPAMLAEGVYVWAVLLLFAPASYLIDTDNKAGVTDILRASVETMRRSGKCTYFLNVVVPWIIKSIYLSIALGVFMLFLQISSATPRAALCIIWLIVATLLYIVFAPVFTLASDIANRNLFSDIVIEPDVLNNRTKGLFIKRCTVGNSLAAKGRDANLESMFDSQATSPVDPPDTKYVPPTDWSEKMQEYDPADDDAANEHTAGQESSQEDAAERNDAQEDAADTQENAGE